MWDITAFPRAGSLNPSWTPFGTPSTAATTPPSFDSTRFLPPLIIFPSRGRYFIRPEAYCSVTKKGEKRTKCHFIPWIEYNSSKSNLPDDYDKKATAASSSRSEGWTSCSSSAVLSLSWSERSIPWGEQHKEKLKTSDKSKHCKAEWLKVSDRGVTSVKATGRAHKITFHWISIALERLKASQGVENPCTFTTLYCSPYLHRLSQTSSATSAPRVTTRYFTAPWYWLVHDPNGQHSYNT